MLDGLQRSNNEICNLEDGLSWDANRTIDYVFERISRIPRQNGGCPYGSGSLTVWLWPSENFHDQGEAERSRWCVPGVVILTAEPEVSRVGSVETSSSWIA